MAAWACPAHKAPGTGGTEAVQHSPSLRAASSISINEEQLLLLLCLLAKVQRDILVVWNCF